jgi:Rad3-related DNA helicase
MAPQKRVTFTHQNTLRKTPPIELDYGHIYPAMGKAIQAAGRVIRPPTDVGTIVFLDKRYMWDNYKKCLPRHPNVPFIAQSRGASQSILGKKEVPE